MNFGSTRNKVFDRVPVPNQEVGKRHAKPNSAPRPALCAHLPQVARRWEKVALSICQRIAACSGLRVRLASGTGVMKSDRGKRSIGC